MRIHQFDVDIGEVLPVRGKAGTVSAQAERNRLSGGLKLVGSSFGITVVALGYDSARFIRRMPDDRIVREVSRAAHAQRHAADKEFHTLTVGEDIDLHHLRIVVAREIPVRDQQRPGPHVLAAVQRSRRVPHRDLYDRIVPPDSTEKRSLRLLLHHHVIDAGRPALARPTRGLTPIVDRSPHEVTEDEIPGSIVVPGVALIVFTHPFMPG